MGEVTSVVLGSFMLLTDAVLELMLFRFIWLIMGIQKADRDLEYPKTAGEAMLS